MSPSRLCVSVRCSVSYARAASRCLRPWVLCLLLPALAGCLTVETKEYYVTLQDDGSGEARILFRDIQSETDDTTDVSSQDFQQLIEVYLHGDGLEKENPGFRNVRKRLYEENGKLCAEVSLAFDSLAVLRLFRYDENGPLMYFVGSPLSAEILQATNGTFGRDWMPVIFWPPATRELFIKTRVNSQATYQRPLLAYFRKWEQAGKTQK